jgi:hypothetical protein
MLTMKSSSSRAPASWSLLGVDRTGLPASVTSARIWPSPGVRISSASTDTGYSPITSGWPLTLLWPRPTVKPRPEPGLPRVVAPPATGVGNIDPPGRSRLPLSTLTTSINHDAVEPNSVVVVPMRP